jgi:hypothetical protein
MHRTDGGFCALHSAPLSSHSSYSARIVMHRLPPISRLERNSQVFVQTLPAHGYELRKYALASYLP